MCHLANTGRPLGWDIVDIVGCHSNWTSDNYMGHYSVLNLVA